MEETKLDHPQNNDLQVVQWQFRTDLNSNQGSDQWAWQNYPDEENLIIEEAYCSKLKTVNLKDYDIDFKRMVQTSLKNKKIRKVRRQEPSRFSMEIPEANVIAKDQKTVNEAFGTVQHFLEYIMKRTPEAYTLYQKLKAFSLASDKTVFEDLVYQVLVSIEKGAEIRAKMMKTRTIAQEKDPKDPISQARSIRIFIEKNSLILQNFLKAILKVYTMQTFVCFWLNELLRSEDWEEINVLTPYLVCLLYTFQLSDYVLQSQKCQDSQNIISQKLGFVVRQRLYLYRGAALTEKQLLTYNPCEIKYFSWNAITSTSRDRNIAKDFMSSALNSPTKFGVMFLIEIDFNSLEDYHGITDVAEHSQFSAEKEVILAPGTVFELLEITLVDGIYEIHLKVTKDIEEAQEDVALLGILQEQAISKDKAIIDGLPTQKGFRMLELLRGNKLIRKLEIRGSGIGEYLMEEIENFRLTTNIRKEDIILVDNTLSVGSLNVLAHYFSAGNLSDILMSNKVRFRSQVANPYQIMKAIQITELILTDETIERFRETGQLKELWKKFKNEIQTQKIQKISLSIQNIHTGDEFEDFFEWIKDCTSLKDIALTLRESQTISIENFDSLCQAISSAKTLNQLSIKFNFSDERLSLLQNALKPLESLQNLSLDCNGGNGVSDEGLASLKIALINLTPLQHLSLRFGGCHKITDKGLEHLRDALLSFTSLQYLSLEFADCSLSDKGLNSLTIGEVSLKSLQHLNLGFRNCNHISDEGLKSLKDELISLTNLQHLSCNFYACSQISAECLSHLLIVTPLLTSLKHFWINIEFCTETTSKASNHLKNAFASLTPLQPLSLDMKFCEQTTDSNLADLKRELSPLSFLNGLFLDFQHCERISTKGLGDLRDALSLLKSLRKLSLNFRSCKQISDGELKHLKNALITLTSLQDLSLNFNGCDKISDKGLSYLTNAQPSFPPLQNLSLDFRSCNQISDEGLDSLQQALISRASLKHLSLDGLDCGNLLNEKLESLQHLSLEIRSCGWISDEDVNSLNSKFTTFTSLQRVSLDFGGCKWISDEGLSYLKNALRSLTSLQHLSLDFRSCEQITNRGLYHLKDALISLTSLHHLSLNLRSCNQISNGGLKHLENGLVALTSLQDLSLIFTFCASISDEGLYYLSNALRSLPSLQHLSLDLKLCKQISNEGLTSLQKTITSITSLRSSSLYFESQTSFQDKALYDFLFPKQELNHPKSDVTSSTSSVTFNVEPDEQISDEELQSEK